jgi:hypothetical protein
VLFCKNKTKKGSTGNGINIWWLRFSGMKTTANALFPWLISHQPAVLFSQNKPATSTLLSEQNSTSHQPPANRTGCKNQGVVLWVAIHGARCFHTS